MPDVVLVLTTAPEGELGETIARTLVSERLAACVNVLPPMTSFYRWKGTVERDAERQLLIKTTRARLTDLQSRLRELHPYELPELMVLHVADGAPGYLEWVRAETSGG
jgi:periplasmic divalent cation tolerance protein